MSIYDEIEIEDMDFLDEEKIYTYPCPCGDRFIITLVFLFFAILLFYLIYLID